MRRRDLATTTARLAKHVGGRQGRALSATIASAFDRPAIGSQTLVGAQTGRLLAWLGGFQPGVVPYSVKHKMRRHPQVRYSLAAAKAPILRGNVWFDTNSTELQALLNQVFLDSGLFKRALRTSLLAIEFGFSPHEQVWDFEPEFTIGWDIPKGEETEHKEKTFPNLFVPKALKELLPDATTLLRDAKGGFAGLLYGSTDFFALNAEQTLAEMRAGRINTLAPNKCYVHTVGGEWQNHYGVGRLDTAYDPWYWQTIVYLVCNRWFERKADPPLIGYAPSTSAVADPGVSADSFDPTAEEESPVLLLSRGLGRLRSTGDLVVPSDPYFDEAGKPSAIRTYDVKELESKDAHPAFIAYIEHLDRKIARSVLVPDAVAASHEGMGTYGSLQVMADVYVDVQNDELLSNVEQFNAEIVQPFLRYNGIKDRAILRSGGITSTSRDALKDVLLKVVEADTLAEQAFGRIFPNSTTVMADREALLRANNIPFKRPDPDAPAPRPPQDPASAAGGAAAGAGNQPQRGPAKKAAAVSVRMTEDEYVAHKVPTLVREGRSVSQAVTVARSLYARAKKRRKSK